MRQELAPYYIDTYYLAVHADAAPTDFPGSLGTADAMTLDAFSNDSSWDGLWIDHALPGVEHLTDPDQLDIMSPDVSIHFAVTSSADGGSYWEVKDTEPVVTLRIESGPVATEERSWSSFKAGWGER